MDFCSSRREKTKFDIPKPTRIFPRTNLSYRLSQLFASVLYVKRLQRQFDGSIQIISENKAYQNMVVPKEHLGDLEIIGRVVWAGGWMV